MTPKDEIITVGELSTSQLTDVYERLMVPAFREDELLGYEELLEVYTAMNAPPHGVVVAAGRGPVAVALTEWYVERQVLLLAYLAVAEDARGRGFGGLLSDHLTAQLSSVVPAPIAVAEVDDPRVWPGDEGTGDPEARLRFYARRGARLVPVHYFQPSLRGPGRRVPGMLLIRLDQVPGVRADLLHRFLVEYFSACEGEEALQDPAVQELLRQTSAVGARETLPPLSEWRTMPIP